MEEKRMPMDMGSRAMKEKLQVTLQGGAFLSLAAI